MDSGQLLGFAVRHASPAQLKRKLMNLGNFLVVLGERKTTLELCIWVSNSAIDVFPIETTVVGSLLLFMRNECVHLFYRKTEKKTEKESENS